MPTYYISYGEPPRRRRWVFPALGVMGLAALLAAAAVVLYAPADDALPIADSALPAPASEAAWSAGIAAATDKMAYTYYLVDTSESMTRELPNAMAGLSESIAEKAPESQVGIIPFGDDCAEHQLPLLPLDPELAEQFVSTIEIGMAGIETDVTCALETALAQLRPHAEQGHDTEVVLFSDGGLASVINAECDGQVVRSPHTMEGRALLRCHGRLSHEPMPIIKQFSDNGIKINGIYFQPHNHRWGDRVELLTDATGGKFVPVGRAAR